VSVSDPDLTGLKLDRILPCGHQRHNSGNNEEQTQRGKEQARDTQKDHGETTASSLVSVGVEVDFLSFGERAIGRHGLFD
jgi:hypothetical protein